jgi:hypothetical protein
MDKRALLQAEMERALTAACGPAVGEVKVVGDILAVRCPSPWAAGEVVVAASDAGLHQVGTLEHQRGVHLFFQP